MRFYSATMPYNFTSSIILFGRNVTLDKLKCPSRDCIESWVIRAIILREVSSRTSRITYGFIAVRPIFTLTCQFAVDATQWGLPSEWVQIVQIAYVTALNTYLPRPRLRWRNVSMLDFGKHLCYWNGREFTYLYDNVTKASMNRAITYEQIIEIARK